MNKTMIRRIFSLTLPAVLLAVGCAEKELPVLEESSVVKTPLQTKSVNTSEKADAGTLLVYLDEEVALQLAQGEGTAEWEQACAALGVESVEKLFPQTDNEVARTHGLHRWFLLTFPESEGVTKVASEMAKLNDVTAIQYNTCHERCFGSAAPSEWKPFQRDGYTEFNLPFNDPMLVDQWHYINNKDVSVAETSRLGADINVKNAWGLTAGDPRIIVAVCDEGVKYTHPDLKDNMWVNEREIPGNGIDDDKNGYVDDIYGLNATKYNGNISWDRGKWKQDSNGYNYFDGDSGHGTHVAGTIAAESKFTGVVGVAPKSSLMILKALDKHGRGEYKWITNAVNYAVNQKVDIISMSLGGYVDDKNLHKAILKAVRSNILVVCAVGNEGDGSYSTDEYSYPASYEEVISVGAVDKKYNPAYFSNSNNFLDIMAPGVGILSTFKDGGYAVLDGTSMAAPHVAGALALIKNYSKTSFQRNLSESELYAQLIKYTLDLNYDKKSQGNGLLYLERPKPPKNLLKNKDV